MITEMWIDRIARTVGKSPEEIRLLNLYRENDKTYYGQVLDCCQLRACWDHVRLRSIARCLLISVMIPSPSQPASRLTLAHNSITMTACVLI